MKIDFKKIINIKKKSDLKKIKLNEPYFQSNYLFHYFVQLGNITGLKLQRIPIYIENNDGLNGFHLAAKENQIEILEYFIESYPEYIYNRNDKREAFTNFLSLENFTILMNKYQSLDWSDLIINATSKPYDILKYILTNLNFKNLNDFVNLFKIDTHNSHGLNLFLFSIINNNLINQKDKIKILEKYSDKEINAKNDSGEGIIFIPIQRDEEELFDYLLKRNIDLDYYTIHHTNNPLTFALYNDILNNRYTYSKKILAKVKNLNNNFYRNINKYGDNIAHSIIYIRINRNEQILSAENTKSPNYFPDFEILKLIDNYSWNQNNIYNTTPINLIINLDFDIYSKLFDENKIQINPTIFDIIQQEIKQINPSKNTNKWIKLFKSLPEYVEEINNINLKENEYTHCNLFQASFKDISIFTIYLTDTYKYLLVPNMTSYSLTNLTFEDTYPILNVTISKEIFFPWIISYYSSSEYYIHPYLNNIINEAIINGKKKYAVVFISINFESVYHANILIYDFKKMIVERFEPYGNDDINSSLDEILEEELTWNTGLKYLKPGDFLPRVGFQKISDENNLINIKAGDFGGFCLAWCLWYLETKLINQNVDSKTLVTKLIHKIMKLDIKFSEYIRNYSNKINKKRIKYLSNIGINPKEISNINITSDSNIKITNYLINRFNSLNLNQTNK
jgi:hypothetical protein